MGEPLPKQVLDTAVDPTEIVQQSFDLERRGFDQRQVQDYLRAVADSLQDAQQRESEMRTRLGRAVRRAEKAEQSLRDAPTHDAAELNRQFGEQVAAVLEEARVTGEQRIAAAEKSAQQLLSNAKTEASKMRSQADAVLQKRSAEAEVAATDIVADGQAQADAITAQARVEAETLLANAADRVERARDDGDTLIREAEEARAQILEDMERRRRQARAQVERLRVGRDRLLRSYEVVRRTLEETTVELKSSLKEAKVRGDGAARAVIAEPAASREQLEAELRDAKMIGRITGADPAKASPQSDSPATDRSANGRSLGSVLRSPALPRPLDPPQLPRADAQASAPQRLRVTDAMRRNAVPPQPKAPAVAPTLTASDGGATAAPPLDPIAAMIEAAEAKKAGTAAPVSAAPVGDPITDAASDTDGVAEILDGPIDAELAELEDDDLNVIEPSDEIEEVTAVPCDTDVASPGIFAALRAQRSTDKPAKAKGPVTKDASTKSKKQKSPATTADVAPTETVVEHDDTPQVADPVQMPGLEAQRDAVIADASLQLERRLKRALADEQNDLLAGIRAAKKKRVELTSIVGDVDSHVNRYVLAIHEVAAVTYGAGAALIDAIALEGHLPAGAVEELLTIDVVLPIRERLESLDGMQVDTADLHLDPLRAFYRQRKTDHLGMAATRLANLLCVAGLCDALPEDSVVPWASTAAPKKQLT